MSDHPHQRHKGTFRSGGWLPSDPDALSAWVHDFRRKAKLADAPLHPVVQAFAELIEGEPIVRMYAERMIEEVPRSSRYRPRHLTSVEEMLVLVNAVLTYAPEFDEDAFVGCPLDAIFDWVMGTPAGFAFFRLPKVNAMLKAVMHVWCEHLVSPASLNVINASAKGWKCKAAREQVGIEAFVHKPSDAHWGFSSWNDFFTRRLKPGARPVAFPDDPKVIVSPCEATPYRIGRELKLRDRFWIKGQPYSLIDILAGDEAADSFAGGTLWQGFLSAFNYHRWHSPVDGTILKTSLVAGTYFSEVESEGEDSEGPNSSQAYLAHVAARALIHILADDPAIGHMVVIPIGMGEISSCVIDPRIKAGAHVGKGEELGYFQYGGSTLVCLFRPNVIDAFALAAIPQTDQPHTPALRVNAMLARSV